MEKDIVNLLQAQSKPMSELVFNYLRNNILSRSYEPSMRLIETEIAKQLGISRTPIREAFRKLELEGLVKYIPKKGVVVTDIREQDMKEIFEVRMVLEGLIAKLAAERTTPEEMEKMNVIMENMERAYKNKDTTALERIHREYNIIFSEASKNKRLCDMVKPLQEYISKSRQQALLNEKRIKDIFVEHKNIVDAIKNRDEKMAEKYAREHVRNSMIHYFSLNLWTGAAINVGVGQWKGLGLSHWAKGSFWQVFCPAAGLFFFKNYYFESAEVVIYYSVYYS